MKIEHLITALSETVVLNELNISAGTTVKYNNINYKYDGSQWMQVDQLNPNKTIGPAKKSIQSQLSQMAVGQGGNQSAGTSGTQAPQASAGTSGTQAPQASAGTSGTQAPQAQPQASAGKGFWGKAKDITTGAIKGVGDIASAAAGGISQTVGAAAGGLGKGYHTARQGKSFGSDARGYSILPTQDTYRGDPYRGGAAPAGDEVASLRAAISAIDQRLQKANLESKK